MVSLTEVYSMGALEGLRLVFSRSARKLSSVSTLHQSGELKIVDPLSKRGFQKLFGTEKAVTADFLNSVIQINPQDEIANLTFIPLGFHSSYVNENRPSVNVLWKTAVGHIIFLHLKSVDFPKEEDITANHTYLEKRIESGALKVVDCLEVQRTLRSGTLSAVRSIVVAKQNTLIPQAEVVTTRVHRSPGISTTTILALSQFNKTASQLRSARDRWLFLLKGGDTRDDLCRTVPFTESVMGPADGIISIASSI